MSGDGTQSFMRHQIRFLGCYSGQRTEQRFLDVTLAMNRAIAGDVGWFVKVSKVQIHRT